MLVSDFKMGKHIEVLSDKLRQLESGEIKDWAASCGPMTLMFNNPPNIPELPAEELST